MRKVLTSLLVVAMLLGSAAWVFAGGAQEEGYPNKDITIIVPYGAGGSTDQFTRALAPHVEEALGVDLVIRNVSGGGGAVGFSETLAAEPDGYTATIPNNAMFTLEGMGHVNFTYEDFDVVGRIISEDYVLTTHKNAPFSNIEEFVDYVQSNPGELQIGHSGVGSSTHIVTVALMDHLDADVELVPYDGGSPATTALMGEHVDAIVQHPAEIISAVESGELVGLASMGEERPLGMDQVPTMSERGFDFTVLQWRGIGFPAGISDEVEQAWVDALEQATNSPEFQKTVEEQLLAQMDLITGDEVDQFVEDMAGVFIPVAEQFAD